MGASSDPARVGTVVKLASDGRHLWVRWDGTGRPQLFFKGYLERVRPWRYALKAKRNRRVTTRQGLETLTNRGADSWYKNRLWYDAPAP
jgi:hypothetical protein